MVPNFTSSCLWPSIRQVAESRGPPPSVPISPPGHLPREQLRAGSTFPAGFSLTAESSRTGVNWHPLEVQECSPWDFFPETGRNQTLSKLIVLHSEELSGGISSRGIHSPSRYPSQTRTGSHPRGPSSRSPTTKTSQGELGKVLFVIQIHLSNSVRWGLTMASSKERPSIFSIGIDLRSFTTVSKEPGP